MYCKQCGQRLEKDALFCFHCGAEQELIEEPAAPVEPEKAYCTQCGAELRQGAAFCVRCGAGREEPPIGEQPAEPLPEPPDAEPVPDKAFCIHAVRSWRKGRYSASCAGQGRIAKRLLWLQPPKGNSSPCHLNLPKRRKKAASLPLYCRCSCWRLRWGR